MPVGDPQFNRQQDQTNASRVSLGGGGIRANNYLLDGVPITELRGRAVLNPTIEAIEEVKVQVHTYDAEMGRTGGGVFNVDGEIGHQRVPRRAASTRPGRSGASRKTTSTQRRADARKDRAGRPVLPAVRRRRRRPDLQEPDVLLGRDRRLSIARRRGTCSTSGRPLGSATAIFRDHDPAARRSRLFNPWCRGGVASARCPATGTDRSRPAASSPAR